MGIRRKICDLGDRVFRFYNQLYPKKGIIINFHRVLPKEEADKSIIAISIEQFREIIELIDELTVVKPLDRLDEGGFFITFDDGFYDIYDYAYPILKEKQMPFTIFMVTNTIENHDSNYLYGEKLNVLLQDSLCTIGSHTNKHLPLRNLSKEDAWRELADSKMKLEKLLNRKIDLCAFPEGSWHAFRYRDVRLCEKAGYVRNFLTMSTWLTTWGIRHRYMTPRYSIYQKNYEESKCIINNITKSIMVDKNEC